MTDLQSNPMDSNAMEEMTSSEMEQFDDMLSNYLETMSDLELGQLAKATIVEIKKDHVLLDVGDKAEGIAHIREFQDFQGNLSVKPGDELEVIIEGRDSDSGQLKVSYRKARQRGEWTRLLEAYEKGTTVKGVITRALKNGVLVDVGMPCFLPASQIDIGRIENLESMAGKEVECYVIDVDRQRRRGVLSRRKVLAEEQQKKRSAVLDSLEVDQTIEGKVKSIVDFGVFIDLGGLDALVPREEVAWEKRVNVAEALKVGTKYKFKITGVDRERARVTLSRRQTKPDPWAKVEEDYPAELTVKGTVTNLTNNCAYIVLADGIEGRIHRDNLSWSPTVKKPSDMLKKNQEIEAQVLGYDKEKRLLDLGIKQATTDPWADIDERFPTKSRHTVKITDIVAFGAFVQIDEHTKGLIHVSDMSYDKSLRDPKKVVSAGDEVEVQVLKVDKDARRINFGMKQLEDDPFVAFVKKNPQGSVLTGTVTGVTAFGAFVQLAPLVEGLLHNSQWSSERTEQTSSEVKVGDEVTVKIIKIEKGPKKINLSRRAHLHDEERREVEQFKKAGPAKATTNIGSLLQGLDITVKR